jgi:hypothetical protein
MGFSLLSYCIFLRHQLRVAAGPTTSQRLQTAQIWTMGALIALATLFTFQAAAVLAELHRVDAAKGLETTHFSRRPDVLVYSKVRIFADASGVSGK